MSLGSLSWINFILTTIVSAVISVYVNKYIIERDRKKREHSKILNEGSLKIWLEKIDDFCKLDTQFSHEEEKIVALELGNLEIIPHYQSLENHMKTGYPKEWKFWNEFRDEVKRYNEKRANILEDIRKKFLKESKPLNLVEYYPKPYKTHSENYVRPDKISEDILKEVENRLSGYDKWWSNKPNIGHYSGRQSLRFYNISARGGGNLVNDLNKSNVEFCKIFILSAVENPEIIQKAEELSKIDDEIKKKREKFENKLKELISHIELGNKLKGKCNAC